MEQRAPLLGRACPGPPYIVGKLRFHLFDVSLASDSLLQAFPILLARLVGEGVLGLR